MSKLFEYVGDIPELRGQDAQIRPIDDNDEAKWLVSLDRSKYIMVMFEDGSVKFNGQSIGRHWYPFPKSHFRAVSSPQKRII
jgi:hypothetical protein